MATQSGADGTSEPLQHAGPVRRIVHYLLALAGWVLFVYWWLLVLRQTGREQIVWTLVFIGISLAVIVLVTALWVVHNVRIFRRKGPRLHVGARPVAAREGVPALAPAPVRDDSDLRSARVVRIVVDGGMKAYRAGADVS